MISEHNGGQNGGNLMRAIEGHLKQSSHLPNFDSEEIMNVVDAAVLHDLGRGRFRCVAWPEEREL